MTVTTVIPTVGRPSSLWFDYLLNQLDECQEVSRIVVVNNSSFRLDTKYRVPGKVIEIAPCTPLEVNHSWNLGMELCRTPMFLLVNDDVLCSKSVLHDAIKALSARPKYGLLTVSTDESRDITPEQYHRSDRRASFTTEVTSNDRRVGWFMLGRTEFWAPIDRRISTFYGDDLLWMKVRRKALAGCLQSRRIIHWRSMSVDHIDYHSHPDHAQWPMVRRAAGF